MVVRQWSEHCCIACLVTTRALVTQTDKDQESKFKNRRCHAWTFVWGRKIGKSRGTNYAKLVFHARHQFEIPTMMSLSL